MDRETESLITARECIEESRKLLRENRLEEAAKVACMARDMALELEEFGVYMRAMNLLLVISGIMYDDAGVAEYFIKAIEVGKKYELHNELSIFYLNMGSDFQDLNDIESAEKYYKMAIEERKLIKDEGSVPEGAKFELVMSMNLGELYAKAGEFEKAKEQLDITRKEIEKIKNKNDLFEYESFVLHQLWLLGYHDEVNTKIDDFLAKVTGGSVGADYVECVDDVCDLLKRMELHDEWKTVLEKMENYATVDFLKLHLKILEMWMDYYKTIGDNEGYIKTCTRYAELVVSEKESNAKERARAIKFKVDVDEAEKKRRSMSKNLYVDTLTGVGNRAKMLEDAAGIIEESVKNKIAVTVGLIDIDYFKECNDTYGHIRGDECLKSVASVIQNSVGKSGFVYRFGGDEFLVLLPHTSKVDKVEALAEKIQTRINDLDIKNEKSPISDRVTISQGYTMGVAEENDKISTLIDLADKVLYKAKRYGKNNHKFMRISEILAGSMDDEKPGE